MYISNGTFTQRPTLQTEQWSMRWDLWHADYIEQNIKLHVHTIQCNVSTVVSQVSAHGCLTITYICPRGHLPGRKIACNNIVVFSLTPSNLVRRHLPGILR